MKRIFLTSILFLLCGWSLSSVADTQCPISRVHCLPTVAEVGVKHDLPDNDWAFAMRQGCLHFFGQNHQNHFSGYCTCIANTLASTPGEWRVIARRVINKTNNEGLQAFYASPHPFLTQLNDQAGACEEKTLANRFSDQSGPPFWPRMLMRFHPLDESTRSAWPRPPGRFYERMIGRRVARQVRLNRKRIEKHAMTRNGGIPVTLQTGTADVAIIVASDGHVIHVHNIHSTSVGIWLITQKAIWEASPFPPPDRWVILHLNIWANDPQPGA